MFPDMHTIVATKRIGVAEVLHDRPSRLEIMRSSWKGMHTEDRIHTRLLIRGRVAMTDADFERQTNVSVVLNARGDVLIAGLGIGMVLEPILKKPEVNSVTVIEKERDVIDCVAPNFFPSAKLKVIKSDVWTWRPEPHQHYDVIYFDIWPEICTDNLAEMTRLHRAFRKYLRPNGWMDSWCRDYLRSEKRRGR